MAQRSKIKWLVHNYTPTDGESVVTMQLDDHWFRMAPGEPYEMATDSNGRELDHPDFYAAALLGIYGGIYGIVEIEQTRSKSGIALDIDKALRDADDKLLLNRHVHINKWAADQIQDRVREGKPVLAPTGFVAESIAVLNIDVTAKFGFRPIGWDFRPDPNRPVDGAVAYMAPAGADDIAVLRRENQELKDGMEELRGMLAELMAEKKQEQVSVGVTKSRR